MSGVHQLTKVSIKTVEMHIQQICSWGSYVVVDKSGCHVKP